ncbi:hypothetical protein VB734_11720 [Synechococcus sp. BA-124 BA4]|uniref:hypothetical protein n=1 Tax=unclassified Synechococcus TaxID=2626047 RepID=UPI0018CFB050|nr:MULTISPECIES: hypothetical protein [unclassified Synechococcus]MEA5400705.1 hypothetical protein [Synechococcus sp. BA-124 BA4]QPN57791.1 hypothetical protein I1E95_06945 [Synechococcus sp. CBW1107]
MPKKPRMLMQAADHHRVKTAAVKGVAQQAQGELDHPAADDPEGDRPRKPEQERTITPASTERRKATDQNQ